MCFFLDTGVARVDNRRRRSRHKVNRAARLATTGLQVAGGLFNRHVVGHYVESLNAVIERGFYETVRESSEPYVEAVWNNFAGDKQTLTEDVVTGRLFGRAAAAIRGWFGRKKRPGKVPDSAGSANPPAASTG